MTGWQTGRPSPRASSCHAWCVEPRSCKVAWSQGNTHTTHTRDQVSLPPQNSRRRGLSFPLLLTPSHSFYFPFICSFHFFALPLLLVILPRTPITSISFTSSIVPILLLLSIPFLLYNSFLVFFPFFRPFNFLCLCIHYISFICSQ